MPSTFAAQGARSAARGTLALLYVLAISSFAGTSLAQDAEEALAVAPSIDPDAPQTSVPTPEEAMRDPMRMNAVVMELAALAADAEKKREYAAAGRYYEALAKAVPERATAFGKACRAYALAGDNTKALGLCRSALGRPGLTVADASTFVRLSLAVPGLTEKQVTDVDAVVAHVERELSQDTGAQLEVADLHCQVATRFEDLPRLEACVSRMSELSPADPRTFAYASMLALAQEDWVRVRTLVDSARAAGIPASGIDYIEKLVTERRSLSSQKSPWKDLRVLGGGLALLALAAMVYIARTRRTVSGEAV
jgi:hypothetical protein